MNGPQQAGNRRLVHMKLRFASLFGMSLLLSLILSFGAAAQTSKGTIVGVVTDPSGASVVNATVTARSLQNGEIRTVTTGSNGEYRITAVLPGAYEVKATSQGFADLVLDRVEVAASVDTSLDLHLQVTGTAQTVMVEAS